MQSNSKVTPKSCSCQQCTRGKHTKVGHAMMNADERSVRRAVKTELDKLRGLDYNYKLHAITGEPMIKEHNSIVDDLDVPTVPQGNYYD